MGKWFSAECIVLIQLLLLLLLAGSNLYSFGMKKQ
jgi:hypothetical protein